MEMRELGRSGVKVSALCLGTMTFGQQNTQDEGFAQMDYALAQGINFFDTAELYAIPPRAETYGRTEEIVGDWMQARKARDKIVLATKAVGPAPGMPWIRGGKTGFDRANILAALDGSLRRLKTDVIDLYQLHWPARDTNNFGTLGFSDAAVEPGEAARILETLCVLDDCVRAGKIRMIGLSNETPWGAMTFLSLARRHNLSPPVSIQNPYNLLNRSYEVGLAELSLQESCGLLAYSPLARGTLSGKYLDGKIPPGSARAIDSRKSRYDNPRGEAATRAYVEIARRHGLDPAQMAMAFVTARPFVTSNIFGATSLPQLQTNIASAGLVLSDEVLQELEAVQRENPNPCP